MAKKTPLYEVHKKLNAKLVEFTGYELPVQYTSIIDEHKAVRESVGIFDVSHMGEITVTGEGALNTLNYIMTNDFTDMPDGKVRYSLMCNENGGVIDDVLVYKMNDLCFLVVVNAANVDKDYKHIQNNKLENTTITNVSDFFAQIALQGKDAEKVMSKLVNLDEISKGYYTFTKDVDIQGKKVLISRTGYTGESGFEIYTNIDDAEFIYNLIIENGEIVPCGLGARDTLRLEAGMPLYGHEFDEEIKANEVCLNFAIKYNKDFIGKKALEENKAEFKRIGIELIDRGIAREGCELFDVKGNKIGYVTSGTMNPSNGKSIAMARVNISFNDDKLKVKVRKKELNAKVVKIPFIQK